MSSPNAERSSEELLDDARRWWSTDIIDIEPGKIHTRGYPIQDLIGNVTFPEMIWLMLMGELPTRSRARLLEAALVASVDHGPQAPSIAIARMAASRGPAVNGAMASAVNVLDDVHGGPGQQCMEIYAEIRERLGDLPGGEVAQDAVRAATAEVLAQRKEKGLKYMPGFGHRFHPVDPRKEPLLRLVEEAAGRGEVDGVFVAIGQAVEDVISQGRATRIPMNIDGATAVIYCELGLPPELGRGVFVLSRSVGILAHAWEQMCQGGRIKGPQAKFLNYTYTGPERRPVPPVDER